MPLMDTNTMQEKKLYKKKVLEFLILHFFENNENF